jgi:hypothetical protein
MVHGGPAVPEPVMTSNMACWSSPFDLVGQDAAVKFHPQVLAELLSQLGVAGANLCVPSPKFLDNSLGGGIFEVGRIRRAEVDESADSHAKAWIKHAGLKLARERDLQSVLVVAETIG